MFFLTIGTSPSLMTTILFWSSNFYYALSFLTTTPPLLLPAFPSHKDNNRDDNTKSMRGQSHSLLADYVPTSRVQSRVPPGRCHGYAPRLFAAVDYVPTNCAVNPHDRCHGCASPGPTDRVSATRMIAAVAMPHQSCSGCVILLLVSGPVAFTACIVVLTWESSSPLARTIRGAGQRFALPPLTGTVPTLAPSLMSPSPSPLASVCHHSARLTSTIQGRRSDSEGLKSGNAL